MDHESCVNMLKKIGVKYNFYTSDGTELGKMYHMGNPDCVWYLDCKGKEPLMKITRGEICKKKSCARIERHARGQYLPIVAFEVPYSENEKLLRGSLMTLQLTNAAASVIVLIGKSAEKHMKFANKLTKRYSFMRLRIWPEKYVKDLFEKL